MKHRAAAALVAVPLLLAAGCSEDDMNASTSDACKSYDQIKGRLGDATSVTQDDVQKAAADIAAQAAKSGNEEIQTAAANLTKLVSDHNADQVKETEAKFTAACK